MSLSFTLRKIHGHSSKTHSFTGAYRATCGLERLTYDVMFYIASVLDLPTLQAWRATCTRADESAAALLRTRYHKALRRYFPDPAGFRAILRVTGSVISGSSALAILDYERADKSAPRDIDIYTPIDFADRLHTYLTRVAGYMHLQTHTPRYHEDSAGFLTIAHYENYDAMRVDIIKSCTHSALYPIPFSWSSHLMNYVSADSFCIAYPNFTLHGRGLTNPMSLTQYQYAHQRIVGYMFRSSQYGYDFRLHPYAWEADAEAECALENDEGCPRTIRYFGDPFCLTGTFTTLSDATRSKESRAQPNKGLLVRWWRGGNACGGNCQHECELSTRFFPHVATHRVPRGFFEAFVGGRCVEAVCTP